MRSPIELIGVAREKLFSAVDPDALARVHPTWQRDVCRFGPWRLVGAGDAHGGETPIWQARKCSGSGRICICGRTSSTMDALLHLIGARGLSPWDSVMAVEQLQGRGQRGRPWRSPPGNVYASWYWPDPGGLPGGGPGWTAMASLLAGDAVAAALERMGLCASIKWPNDLLVADRKLCGILVEHRGGRLVVGVGINVAASPDSGDLGDAFAVDATSLAECGIDATPLDLWAQIVDWGRRRLCHLLRHSTPDLFVELLKRRLAWMDREVTIRKSPEDAFCAEIKGLSPDGGLLVKRQGGQQVIYTGSILPADNLIKSRS